MRPGMAQEEYNQRCSNSSSGGGGAGGCGGGGGCCRNGCGGGGNRSSKKLKQKKVPQRGLGVAQLEKIREEEQQKRDAAAAAMQAAAMWSPNSLVSPSNSSCLALQCATNFRHNPSPPSISLPTPSPTDLSSPNSIFRSANSTPNMDVLNPNPVPLSKPSNGGGGEIGWPAISGLGQGNWPKLWNGDYDLEGENHRLDQYGFGIRSNMKLPYESSPIWPPPNPIQRIQQFQQQPSSSSMVNVSSGTSSSSVMNYHQMEPPSNQSFCGKNYTPMWPQEEKMVGMKRPCPFSLENSSGPPFPCKCPPTLVPPITRTDESASCSNGVPVNGELNNPTFREGPLSSTVMSDELNSKKLTKENRDLNGDFLSLAPPTTVLPHPSSKLKHLSVSPQNRELSEFEHPPSHQGSAEVDHQSELSGGSTQQQRPPSPPPPPFYSFFPSAKANTTATSCSGQVGEKLDLNLKL